MQPKKKNTILPIIYIVSFFIILLFALHGAIVYEDVTTMFELGEIRKNQQIATFITMFADRTNDALFSISFNQYTPKWLMYGGVLWLVIVLGIESSKRNFIHGKEFGTARWGTQSDIQDLFAENIKEEEIKKAKRLGSALGRQQVKSEIYKQCEKDGQIIFNAQLDALKEREGERKLNKSSDRKLYADEKARIKKQVKADVELAKKQAWKPAQFKEDYENRLKEIKESQASEEEKRKLEAIEKSKYEDKLKDFYNYAGKVAKINLQYKDADMILTQTERISIYNYKLNNNTLVIGGSGSGKTRSYVMPNLLQAHSSFIVTDPKGEILAKAGHFLQDVKGYNIRVLNLDEKSLCDGYNPFVYVHPERDGYEERVLSLIETIIINTEGGEKKNSSDPFWPMAERLFLQSIFFFTADGFIPEDRNMNTVLKLIQMLQIEEENDNKDSDLDIYVDIFADNFGEDHIGVQQFREFRSKASGKTAKSIVISAVARLAPFKTSSVRRIFSYDNMCLDRVGEEKTAIFVVVPPTDSTFNFIAGMLFTQLFQELQYCATQVHKHEGQRLPVPCRFILDEFATTCTIPNFVKILAYARSLGIGITPIIQSLEQLKNMYKDEWGVIIDNCNTMLFLGSVTHMDTLEYISKLVGKGTFDKRTSGQTRGRQGSSSTNEDVVGRELMMADDIRRMPKSDCILIVGGRPAFYSKKYEYKEHPNYRFTSDANKSNSFDYKPKTKEDVEREEAEAENFNHREDDAERKILLTPSKNAEVSIEPIKLEIANIKSLSFLNNNLGSMEFISDDEMNVPDGESSDSVNNAFLQELMEEDANANVTANATVSQTLTTYFEELKKDKIQIEENMLVNVNRLIEIHRNLEIISDDEMRVPDGESSAQIDEKMAEFIMDDDENKASEEEVNDILENLTGFRDELSSLDKNPDLE